MSTNPLTSITTTLLDVKRLFEKMNRVDQDKFRTSAHKELVELEKLIDAIHAKCAPKEKEPIPCPHCDKKFMNLKLHITNSHTCDYCETEVADKYKHYDTCSQMIEQLTDRAKEKGLTWVHSEFAKYKVKNGNFYEWDDTTNTVGAYAGRLKADGTLDKTAAAKGRGTEPCPHCDGKLINLKNHILNIHTCMWCHATGLKNKYDHMRSCKEYNKWDENGHLVECAITLHSAAETFVPDSEKVKEKNKDSEPCPHCDKKFMNLESHIYNIHTCAYCKDTTVHSLDVHSCKPYLKHLKYAKESNIRRGINYIQNDIYVEKNGNVYKNPFKYPSKNYDYVGRLLADGSIDRSAPQVIQTTDGGKCTLCENNYGDIKAHLFATHTCMWCHAAGLKDTDDHMRTCKEYIKWDAEPSVHQETESRQVTPKKKKERIPAHIKTIVWRTYIGNEKPEAKCYCCKHETVDIRNFECGHVVAEAKGGPLTVDNLRPICRGCNGAMGTMSMEEYCQKFFGRSVIVATAAADDDVFGLFTEPLTSTQLVVDPFADLLG